MSSEKNFTTAELSSLLFGERFDSGMMFVNAMLALESGDVETTTRMAQNIDPEMFLWGRAVMTATSEELPETKKFVIDQMLDSVKPEGTQWEMAYHKGRKAVIYAVAGLHESRETFQHAIMQTKENRNLELLATEIKLRQLQNRTLGDFLPEETQISLWKEIESASLSDEQKANTGISLLLTTKDPSKIIIDGIHSHNREVHNLNTFWLRAISDIDTNNGLTLEELCQFVLFVPTQDHWSTAGTSFTNESKSNYLVGRINKLSQESDLSPILKALMELKTHGYMTKNLFKSLVDNKMIHTVQPEVLKQSLEAIQDDQIFLDTVFEVMKWTQKLEKKGEAGLRQTLAIETTLPTLESRMPTIRNHQTFLEATARDAYWRRGEPEKMQLAIESLDSRMQTLLNNPTQYPWGNMTSSKIGDIINSLLLTNEHSSSDKIVTCLRELWEFVEVLDKGEMYESQSLSPHNDSARQTYNTDGELFRVLLQLKNRGILDRVATIIPPIAQAKAELIDK